MKLDMAGSREVLHAALDAGITLSDTADSCGTCEKRLGKLRADHRDGVIIATTFGPDAAKRGNGNGTDWGRGARRSLVRAVRDGPGGVLDPPQEMAPTAEKRSEALWSEARRIRRPSAFQVNRAKRCANLRNGRH